MANYTGMFLSNEFKVSDEERLRDILSRIVTDCGEEVEVYKDPTSERFCFGVYDSYCGYETEEITKKIASGEIDIDSEEYCELTWRADNEWMKDIGSILLPDEACIVTFIGHEKMRYISADAAIITSKGIECVDLLTEADKKATKMLKLEASHNFHILG